MKDSSAIIGSALLVLFLYAIPSYGTDTETMSQDTGTLTDFVERAFEGNNRLNQLEKQEQSARNEIQPAGTLDDPRLQAGAMNLPTDNYSFDDQNMTSKDLALMQKVPYPGRLNHKQKKALAEYKAARATMHIYRAKLAHKVRSTILDLWTIRQRQDIAGEEQEQLKRLLSIARSRYETGKGIQADFERASTRISRLDNRLLKLQQREQERLERLSRLLGYDGQNSKNINVSVRSETEIEPQMDPTEIENSSPILRRDTELITAAQHGVRLAELDFYPNFDVGMRYRQRENRDDFASLSVTIPLPIWSESKQKPRSKSKKHQLDAMKSKYRNNLDEIRYSFDETMLRLRRIRRQLTLYDEKLRPEAQQTMDSTLSAYRVGNVEFISVLEAELELFKVREELVQLKTDHQKTLSKLAKIAGFERMEELQ